MMQLNKGQYLLMIKFFPQIKYYMILTGLYNYLYNYIIKLVANKVSI